MWFYYLHSSSVCIFSLILMSKLEISNESWIIQEGRVAIDRRISERKHCAQQEPYCDFFAGTLNLEKYHRGRVRSRTDFQFVIMIMMN